MQIIPAILPHTEDELKEKLEIVKDFTGIIQIDLVDGVVGVDKTWIPNESFCFEANPLQKIQFDLMVESWKEVLSLPSLASFPIDSLVFHIDSFDKDAITFASSWCLTHKIRCGFSVTNDTPLAFLLDALFSVKETSPDIFVQVMGIRTIGLQGQIFDEESLVRIKKIREHFSDMFIQVDGSMKINTAQMVRDVGANACVAGSYLFSSPDVLLEKLQEFLLL